MNSVTHTISMEWAPILWSIARMIPAAIVILACLLYLSKSSGPAAILMLIGSLLQLLLIFVSIAMSMALSTRAITLQAYLGWSNLIQFVGLVGYLLFAAGFFVLVANNTGSGSARG